jgi:hypothetical protein
MRSTPFSKNGRAKRMVLLVVRMGMDLNSIQSGMAGEDSVLCAISIDDALKPKPSKRELLKAQVSEAS